MDARRRSGLGGGILLIVLGVLFLVIQMVPSLHDLVYSTDSWPLIVVGVGVLFFLIGLVTGAYGMSVPAAVIGGIGGLLYYQNATGDWASWAYVWTLIPGFSGIGTLLDGLMSRRPSEVRSGLWLIVISLIMFVIFASFLGGPVILGTYWPVALIVLGVLILVERLFRRH
jgi:hypothetical protein